MSKPHLSQRIHTIRWAFPASASRNAMADVPQKEIPRLRYPEELSKESFERDFAAKSEPVTRIFFSLLGEFCALHLFLPKWDASPWREFCFTFFNHQTSKSKFPCNRGGGLSAHYKDSLFFELFQPSKKQIKGNHRRLDFWLAGLFWSDENMAWRSMGFFYGWGRCLDLFNAIFYRFYRGKSPSNHHLGKTPPKFHSEKWWLEGRRSFPLPIVNGTFQGRTRC